MLALLDSVYLSQRAGDWLVWFVDASVKATVALTFALALGVVLRRAPARVRHGLWSAALLGVLTLPVLSHLMPSWQLPLVPSVTIARLQSTAEAGSGDAVHTGRGHDVAPRRWSATGKP